MTTANHRCLARLQIFGHFKWKSACLQQKQFREKIFFVFSAFFQDVLSFLSPFFSPEILFVCFGLFFVPSRSKKGFLVWWKCQKQMVIDINVHQLVIEGLEVIIMLLHFFETQTTANTLTFINFKTNLNYNKCSHLIK